MSKVNDLLSSRFRKATETLAKITDLAEMTSQGNLSSFSGVFRVAALTKKEEEILHNLLSNYSTEKQNISSDFKHLSAITSEVKAINNQAAMLHGERIKRAQEILKTYREGAFTSWLLTTYGNRQTPYNFLQYFELYTSIPKGLQAKVEEMPRQAVYTLATRNCPQEEKEEVIKSYNGETKKQLLSLIRQKFPLKIKDKRAVNLASQTLSKLEQIHHQLKTESFSFSPTQKKQILEVLQSIQTLL